MDAGYEGWYYVDCEGNGVNNKRLENKNAINLHNLFFVAVAGAVAVAVAGAVAVAVVAVVAIVAVVVL